MYRKTQDYLLNNSNSFHDDTSIADKYGALNLTNTSAGNETCCETGEEKIIVPVVFSLVIFLGCAGNAIVIGVILKTRRRMRNTTNLFMLNLAAADLMFLLFCIPFHAVIYTVSNWPFGNIVCKGVHFLQYASMFTSVFTLVAMAFDRYCAVNYHTHRRLSVRVGIAAVTCLCIWLVSLGVASPWLIFYTVKTYPYIPEPLEICADDWASRRKDRPIYFLCLFILGYALPFVIIFVLSILTVLNLSRANIRTLSPISENNTRRRATRFVITLVCVFGVCWLPYHVTWLWANFQSETFLNNYAFYYMRVFSFVLSYTNSMVNPYIYAFYSVVFRRFLRFSFLTHACAFMNNNKSTTSEVAPVRKVCDDFREQRQNGLVSSSWGKIDQLYRESNDGFESVNPIDLTILRVQSCPTEMYLLPASVPCSSKGKTCASLSA